ncbi:hypothetical protein HMPREF9395_0211 [Streptococcus sanguinis SK1058]|nr:hypothetical protein HMPREF9395_0211 [Streptococcus sanguinis SK1058]
MSLTPIFLALFYDTMKQISLVREMKKLNEFRNLEMFSYSLPRGSARQQKPAHQGSTRFLTN